MQPVCLLPYILGFPLLTSNAYAPKDPLIETRYGSIRGTRSYSEHGREYSSFQGIPYAKPPVGDLRFKAPQPPEAWSFPLDAREPGTFCIQKNYFFKDPKVEGSEDCLYLNVYTPAVSTADLLPVMVFIHWGGFFAGRGTSDYLGPDYFMDKDVILVTFNYRLGVLGFLSTLDDEAPGNYALKDQSAALKWVQDNIGSFGGDPNQVTIFGQSAGGGSVHYHLLSPLSKGLFHRAISQSGSALALWAKPRDVAVQVTAAQATFVGCGDKIGNNTALIECLRSVDAEQLVASADKFKLFSIEPLTPYTTVLETKTERNPDPFFTKEPLQIIQDGEFQHVPWIIGTVQDEGILRASQLLRQSAVRQQLNAAFGMVMPSLLGLSLSVGDNYTELWEDILEQYKLTNAGVDINDANSIQNFINLYTDRAFLYGSYQSVMLHSLKGHKPVWFYNFNYRGKNTYGDLFAATDEDIPNFNWGVSHCDDLLYLFSSPGLLPPLSDPTDLSIRTLMIDLWTNFAIYGHPTPPVKYKEFQWPSLDIVPENNVVSNEQLQVLNIMGSYHDETVKMEIITGLQAERMRFWENETLAENFHGLN